MSVGLMSVIHQFLFVFINFKIQIHSNKSCSLVYHPKTFLTTGYWVSGQQHTSGNMGPVASPNPSEPWAP